MHIMRTVTAMCLIPVFFITTGCGFALGVEYSEQSLGIERSIPETVEEAYKTLGMPDVHHCFGDYRILGWKRTRAYGVYGRIFYVPVAWSSYDRYSLGIVADGNGKVISCGNIKSGAGYTVLSTGTAPVVMRHETAGGSK